MLLAVAYCTTVKAPTARFSITFQSDLQLGNKSEQGNMRSKHQNGTELTALMRSDRDGRYFILATGKTKPENHVEITASGKKKRFRLTDFKWARDAMERAHKLVQIIDVVQTIYLSERCFK